MLLRDFFDFIRNALRLTDEMQKTKSDVKKQEERYEKLSEFVTRLAQRQEILEQKHNLEQEILLLKLENRILRELKGLPPAKSTGDSPDDPKN